MAGNSGSEEVILLDYDFSPFAMRVRISLKEKGIQFESKKEDLFHKSPLLLEMNPVHKLVPVLIHNGKPICESLVIVQYIDEVWNDKSPLLPADPLERARAKFWADYVDKIYVAWRSVWLTKGEAQDTAKKALREGYKVLEGELGDKCYFGGSNFGMADIAFIPFYGFFETVERFGKLSMDEEFPKLVAWGKRCMERESVATTVPTQSDAYDYIVGVKSKLENYFK